MGFFHFRGTMVGFWEIPITDDIAILYPAVLRNESNNLENQSGKTGTLYQSQNREAILA